LASVLEVRAEVSRTRDMEGHSLPWDAVEHSDLLITRSFDPQNPLKGQLISLHGSQVKFQCSVPIASGEALLIHFQSEDESLPLSLEAYVRWERASDNEWIVGCEATHGISESTQHSLALSGFIDRRNAERFAANIPIQTRRSGCASRQPATILDFSDSGFRLVTNSEPPTDGEYFKVFLCDQRGDEVEVVAEVRWGQREDTYSQLGCQICAQSEAVYRKAMSRWRPANSK
jgi:hypothetical protein